MKKIRNRVLWIVLCLFTGYMCLYLFTSPASIPGGDEAIMIGVADRIAHHGFSRFTPQEVSARAIVNYRIFSLYGFTDQSFSKYGLGQSLLDIPITHAFRRARFAVDENSRIYNTLLVYSPANLIAAALNGLFFLTCLRLGYRMSSSFLLTMVLGITTMIWPYSQTMFADPTLGFLWFLAFYAVLSYKSTRKKIWLTIAGTAIGFSFLTKVVALYTLPLFLLYLFYQIKYESLAHTKKEFYKSVLFRLFWFIAPVIASGIILLWFNYIRFEKLFAFGYLYETAANDIRDDHFGFNTPFLVGLYGLLFSTGKGFFFYNPSAILSLFGLKTFRQHFKAEALLILGIICGSILVYSSWWAWHGDFSWGPRFLTGLSPFFILLSGKWMEGVFLCWKKCEYRHWLKRGFIFLLLTVSFGVQIAGLSIKSNDYILTAASVGFFKEKLFNPNWPIRDELLHLHFVPEFSPLVGHLWLMRSIYHKNDDNFMKVYKSPPWNRLNNPSWVPKEVRGFSYNIWWLHAVANSSPVSMKIILSAIILLMSATAFFGFGLYFAFKEEALKG
ncbi:MAG TPA: phospholipid carrier-dependent glycosyltransferase [Nitrospinota bacterium]|nr:phospholipid carrier-dependent glycosyltransferase [Nitrospinota bacterium]